MACRKSTPEAVRTYRSALLESLRCPECRAALRAKGRGFACVRNARHVFRFRNGYVTFAKPGSGKYDDLARAQRYAAVIGFGYQTQHFGGEEPVYRTVSSLVAEALAGLPTGRQPIIVDCGCGVGRVAADCAALAPGGFVTAIDASGHMLEVASRIVLGTEAVIVPDLERPAKEQYRPEDDGFGRLKIRGRGATNVLFARADAENVPVKTGTVDIALSINVVDRLPHGPAKAIRECYRILRPGGRFIMVDPFNWTASRWWRRYPDAESIVKLVNKTGFRVNTWFDQLPYRESRDARGFVHEFRMTVVSAKKPRG